MKKTPLLLALCVLVAACSGGDPVATTTGTDQTGGCSGACGGSTTSLTVADVQQVIAQGVAEAQARGVNATIAVVDRVGNVLAVYRMGAASSRPVTITTTPGAATVSGGLEGIRLPTAVAPVNIDHAAAIAKAITGAYLSSEGNAFSSRTASQIVQEHFNPGEQFQPAGPLFGVQFSQLACSDLMRSFDGVGPSAGPQRSPLGLSADPGGFPLYKSGTVVGGVGVLADLGFYTIDKNIADTDADVDEAIAYAATFSFAAPVDRRGDRITADGKTFRFSDVDFNQLRTSPASAPAFGSIAGSVGALITVPGYFDGVIRAGTTFGQPASGIRADTSNEYNGRDVFVLVDPANVPRYPPRAGTDGASLGAAVLTQNEVRNLLQAAVDVAERTRAQIRRPLGSPARVTISLVDTQGEILGIVRTRDAPVFGTDVSLQKARTAAFMSSTTAAAFLATLPDAKYLTTSDTSVGVTRSVVINNYVGALRTFLGNGTALADGIAYSARANGNLSRPFFPDGIDNEGPGPLSKPAGEWSPFSTGLQLDVAVNAILQHVLFVAGVPVPDVAPGCAGVQLANDLSSVGQTIAGVRLANGLQIFPGSVPIYRGNTLVGALGVSGDGVDQDDMIAFLGVHFGAQFLGSGGLGNAPTGSRADTVIAQGVRLRYVQCPQSPFLNSTDDNVCEGK
jgi:uncharacterized protein GlcG (DUF336 family)